MPFTEASLIESIRRLSAGRKNGLRTGIGDDCAVIKLPSGHEALVTTDFSLEGVHFRREWHPPQAVGHRCLARGLSDIAAMGGEPRAAFLSLALPAKLPRKWVDGFIAGFLKLAGEFSVPLAGGDTAQSPDDRVMADIVVLGSVPAGKAILRSTAKAGDILYVTGDLGMPVAALEKLQQGRKVGVATHRKHFYPQPRLAVGRFLREHHLATAMIDISDGLSTDLSHICEASSVGAVVYAANLPVAKGAGLQHALHGGDEYELLFTARPDKIVPKTVAGVPITRIGEMLRGKQMRLATADGRTSALKPGGWQHFGKQS